MLLDMLKAFICNSLRGDKDRFRGDKDRFKVIKIGLRGDKDRFKGI
jgi:hypothetical protein